MNTLACLTLVLYMEARNQTEYTQSLVGSVVIERAKVENIPICKSIKRKGSYSWMWDKLNTKVDKKVFNTIKIVASRELAKPTITGRYFFNEKKLGKRYKTAYSPITSGKLIFY